ncbi:hypothetical protein [Oceanobacillus kimchii]|uniref:hypothetical protein n=1 Tax=Oceanobacillus kimchii TaxID=746691 RepID=UPI00098507D9|nr:hypothetical protein [Oceanobacillus kimchii]
MKKFCWIDTVRITIGKILDTARNTYWQRIGGHFTNFGENKKAESLLDPARIDIDFLLSKPIDLLLKNHQNITFFCSSLRPLFSTPDTNLVPSGKNKVTWVPRELQEDN